jgi:hypothetical protein
MATLVDRHADRVLGVLSCYDRVIVRGGIRGFDYSKAMESYLRAQVEYATDIVFRRRQDLAPIYESLVRTAVHSVKAAHVATFLGRRLHRTNSEEIGNDFDTRIQGTRIKHRMGPTAIKAYDKAGIILRIETTTNNPKWFKHYRTVAHRDGTRSHELAPLKKSIYSLHDLRQLAVAANRRYLEFLSSLEDPSVAVEAVRRISANVEHEGRTYRGFNFFSDEDVRLFETLLRGEYTIQGVRKCAHPSPSSGQIPITDLAYAPASAVPRAREEDRPYVQVLRHRCRALCDDHGPQAQDACAHPRPGACDRRVTSLPKSCRDVNGLGCVETTSRTSCARR